MTTDQDGPVMDGKRRAGLCTGGLLLFWFGQSLERHYRIGTEQAYFGWLGLGLSIGAASLIIFYGGRGILPGRYRLHSRMLALGVSAVFAAGLTWFWFNP